MASVCGRLNDNGKMRKTEGAEMALMRKSDLVYDDYSWMVYGDDDPKVSGEPDSTFLNRKEGYEVLYFINKLAQIYNFKDICLGKKMERMIHDYLPSTIRSQNDIMTWIEKNWGDCG